MFSLSNLLLFYDIYKKTNCLTFVYYNPLGQLFNFYSYNETEKMTV